MKNLIVIAGCVAVALVGCVTRQAVVDVAEEGDVCGMISYMHLEAKHAHLKSILGIDDAALADTNRFVLGSNDYGHEFTLEKPFGGFSQARVYLDTHKLRGERAPDGRPHQLRRVELKRYLANASTEQELLAELQASCDFVADILGVEPPKAQLVDVRKLRGRMAMMEVAFRGVRTSMAFELADGQHITVALTEPVRAIRDGEMLVVIPGNVEIELVFSKECCGGCVRNIDEKDEKVEMEIDFGPDCRDKLAEALKNGIERRTKRAKRRSAKGDGNKGK